MGAVPESRGADMINKIVICDCCGVRVIFNPTSTDRQIINRLCSHGWSISYTNYCPKCMRGKDKSMKKVEVRG